MALVMIGCGRMGQAMLARWLEAGIPDAGIIVVKPSPLPDELMQDGHVQWVDTVQKTEPAEADAVLLAVKPQKMKDILPDVAAHFKHINPLYISIAAGLPLGFYQNILGKDAAIVRAMPNTPVTIGHGVTTLVTEASLPAGCMALIHQLFEALGLASWLEDESQMDAATALAGSGPAYGYLFIDLLANAAIRQGLPEELARRLAVHTIHGSAAMAMKFEGMSLAALREQVTSKGGTTEAALQQFTKNNQLEKITYDAITAAVERAKALAA